MNQAGDWVERVLPNGETLRFMLGDITGDGQLDQDDVEILTALTSDTYLGEFLMDHMSVEELAACDITGDGRITHADLALLYNQVISQMEKLSVTDELTGLLNRRGLKEQAYFKLRSAKRFDVPLSCLAIDIDFFKKVNDTYGHGAGDAMLCHIAKIMTSSVRLTDLVARHGGEEFVLILEQTDMDGAFQVAEKLRQKMADSPLQYQSNIIPLTVSVGIAIVNQEKSLHQLLQEADFALYEAKHSGRNRSVRYEEAIRSKFQSKAAS